MFWEYNKGSEYYGKYIKLVDLDVRVYVIIIDGGESDYGEL